MKKKPKSATGMRTSTIADIRPSAVSALTSPRNRLRATMVSATVCSTSERFPPTSALDLHRHHGPTEVHAVHALGYPLERLDGGRPSRVSATALPNSRPVGLGDSPATDSTACTSE